MKSDNVNKTQNGEGVVNTPQHYNQTRMQPIEVIEDWKLDFRLANVIKYVYRYRYKGKPLEDLRKARFYLERVINEMENNVEGMQTVQHQPDVLQQKKDESKDQGSSGVERVYFPTAEGLIECKKGPEFQDLMERLQTGSHEDNILDKRESFRNKGRKNL